MLLLIKSLFFSLMFKQCKQKINSAVSKSDVSPGQLSFNVSVLIKRNGERNIDCCFIINVKWEYLGSIVFSLSLDDPSALTSAPHRYYFQKYAPESSAYMWHYVRLYI